MSTSFRSDLLLQRKLATRPLRKPLGVPTPTMQNSQEPVPGLDRVPTPSLLHDLILVEFLRCDML